jgi:hypothetical protein
MRSFYLLCEEPKELTIKGLPMSCHCYSGLITGHDDGIRLGVSCICIARNTL